MEAYQSENDKSDGYIFKYFISHWDNFFNYFKYGDGDYNVCIVTGD
ncbi:hypothetical protein [Staphylococcus succinus]|nr:hypothetical protein [Staphylococcus succinus]